MHHLIMRTTGQCQTPELNQAEVEKIEESVVAKKVPTIGAIIAV